MRTPITPAAPAFDAAGTPFSPEYGDIYHTADSGPGQARHVFLAGNDLPARWREARVFTVLETGFGLGLNFLATWQAWREDAARPEQLHFVSIEKHPFTREGLVMLHARYPEFAPLAALLQSCWPLALPGLHRLHFEGGRVTLTLAFGDVTDILPQLRLAGDAIYLDGFAPDRNPDMWTPALMRRLARLARPGATVATYTTARAVRDALTAAAFVPELRPGYGRKREMLAARFSPRAPLRHGAPPAPQWRERRALVIGAGLAGAGAAERLAARGWAVELLERHPAPAREASGMAAGIIHPLLARDDNGLARLSRAGYLYALEHWRTLEEKGHRFAWTRCGVLQIGRDAREARRMADAARALACPPGYASYKDGLWFPDGSWVRPAELVAALIAAAGAGGHLKLRTGVEVHGLARAGENWRAVDANGATIAEAPVVVLANSNDAIRLVPHGVRLKRVRGQLTCLPPGAISPPGAILAGAGHLVPGADGSAVVGSTYDFEDEDPEPSTAGHAGNLERLELLLPGAAARLDPARLEGTVGFRCVTPDRLPLIGAAPDLGAARAGGVARLDGIYGAFGYASRGLTWSALGGESLASQLDGEPLPLEGDLVDAIDPARFALRRARRGRTRP